MKIHLMTHTGQPLKAIVAAQLNIGTGRDVISFDQIGEGEAQTVFGDLIKGFLNSPLEFASFNFFWQDVPIFLVRELVRHRIGWSYAERSLRFFDATKRDPTAHVDLNHYPSLVPDNPNTMRVIEEFQEQMLMYKEMLTLGVTAQDARSVIGVWYPTAIQTSCSYRALRDMLSLRLSSQAHPAWQDAALQIKSLVTRVSSPLGDGLVDVCTIQGRCVWQSKLDRPCESCAEKGRKPNHVHMFDEGQCSCGVMQ